MMLKKYLPRTSGFSSLSSYTLYGRAEKRGRTARAFPGFVGIVLCFIWLSTATATEQPAGDPVIYHFDIPEQPLIRSLNALSNQTETLVLFPYDLVENRKGCRVKGRYTLKQALDAMLGGTGLAGEVSERGVLTVSNNTKSDDGNSNRKTSEIMSMKDNNCNGKRSIVAAISAILLGGAASSATYAQKGESAGPVIEEVVVTAQRRSQTLQDVPIAMTAVTPEVAKRFGLSSIQDIGLVTPSVDITASPGFLKVYMRGIGQAFVTPGLEAPVAIYLDGGYIQRLGGFNSLLELVDIDRVEALRGPQGTLYGRNATGGALLLHTANPVQNFEGRIAAEYGRFNHRKVEGMLNVPLTDTLSARFAASTVKSDGYIKNVATGRDIYGDDNYTVRGKLRWQPNDISDVVLSVEYQESTPRKSANQLSFGAPICYMCQTTGDQPVGFYETNHNDVLPYDISLLRTTLNATFSFQDYELTSHTGFLDDEAIALGGDNDFTPAPVFFFDNKGIGGKTFTQELVLSSQYVGPLNFLAGFSYLKDDADLATGLRGSAFPTSPGVTNEAETESTAGFAELIYDLTEHVTITLGGRYTKDERTLDAVNNAGFQAFGLPASFSLEDEYSAFTPRFVISWGKDNTNLYYSYTEGFKAGGFASPATSPASAVDPEEIESHEIGIKHQAFANRLTTNVAVFYYKDKDFHSQVIDVVGGGVKIENAGGVEGRGVELEISALPADGLAIGASLAYLDVEYTSYLNAAAVCVDPSGTANPAAPGAVLVTCAPDLTGERVPHAPELSGSIYASYDFRIADWDANLSGLVRSSSSYDFYPGAGGELGHDEQDAYTVTNISGYVMPPGSNIQMGFYLNNAFDEEYLIATTTNAPYGAVYQAAEPRTYGVRLSYDF